MVVYNRMPLTPTALVCMQAKQQWSNSQDKVDVPRQMPSSLQQPTRAVPGVVQGQVEAVPNLDTAYGHVAAVSSVAEQPEQAPVTLKGWKQQFEERLRRVRACLYKAQDRMRAQANNKRRDVVYEVGQKVLLSTTNLQLQPGVYRKVIPRYVGPFVVEKVVSRAAYKLTLPNDWKTHNVFHVSLLKPYVEGGSFKPVPLPVFVQGRLELEVEAVGAHKSVSEGGQKKLKYLVKWAGLPIEQNS